MPGDVPHITFFAPVCTVVYYVFLECMLTYSTDVATEVSQFLLSISAKVRIFGIVTYLHTCSQSHSCFSLCLRGREYPCWCLLNFVLQLNLFFVCFHNWVILCIFSFKDLDVLSISCLTWFSTDFHFIL